MLPTRKNQGWLPSIFNDFFDNDWMEKANATAPAINVVEHENDYCIEVAAPGQKTIFKSTSMTMTISLSRWKRKAKIRKKEKKSTICVVNFLILNSNRQ